MFLLSFLTCSFFNLFFLVSAMIINAIHTFFLCLFLLFFPRKFRILFRTKLKHPAVTQQLLRPERLE